MLVDYERVLLELKGFVAAKTHHGRDGLLAEIAKLEVQHQLAEGLPEKALRLYGVIFSEDMLRSPSAQDRVPGPDDHKDRAQRGDSHNESEEDNDGNGNGDTGRAVAGRVIAIRRGPEGRGSAGSS